MSLSNLAVKQEYDFEAERLATKKKRSGKVILADIGRLDNIKASDLVQKKQEQIDGVVYDMAQATYFHSDVNGNIFRVIANHLVGKPCRVYIENAGFKYHPDTDDEDKREDYVIPDIMIVCDKTKFKGGDYYGVPKFVVETASPSTADFDKTKKFEIYEQAGVSEYWIVNPDGILEVYYLDEGKYRLAISSTLCRDKDSNDYNADSVIKLRDFPDIEISLGEIFDDVV